MIEFIIPLNLPVRTVVATEPTSQPPEWLCEEIARRSQPRQQSLPEPEILTVAEEPPAAADQKLRSEMEHEIEQLRNKQSLFTNAFDELRRATKQVQQQLDGLVHEFQLATVELAQVISAKLIFEEIDQNRFPIENLVHEVVSRLERTTDAVVRLHPEDLALIRELPSVGNPDDEHSVRFLADTSLARGDCKAKAGEISVIYELKRQVEEIRRHLLSTVNGHAET